MKEIILNHGKIALIDDEDYERVSIYKWQYHKGYVSRNDRKHEIYLHNVVLGVACGVDHKDRNPLNCQRNNLRVASAVQNAQNRRKRVDAKSSRYKGVYRNDIIDKWRASITVNGKRIHLGYFKFEFDAAQAYNFAADEYFGEFAVLNIPIMGE
jgi:hypothetical protein